MDINPDSETATEQIDITLSCQQCGSNELTIPDSADTHVTCSACGAYCGRWGDIQTAMNEAVTENLKESLSDMLSKTFDGSDSISFKKAE
jgi:hypothetical protein